MDSSGKGEYRPVARSGRERLSAAELAADPEAAKEGKGEYSDRDADG